MSCQRSFYPFSIQILLIGEYKKVTGYPSVCVSVPKKNCGTDMTLLYCKAYYWSGKSYFNYFVEDKQLHVFFEVPIDTSRGVTVNNLEVKVLISK